MEAVQFHQSPTVKSRAQGAMTIRVLITDDHGVVRQGPRMFLSLDPDIEVVHEAAPKSLAKISGEGAEASAKESRASGG